MWKWTQPKDASRLTPGVLLFGGLGKYSQPWPDVTVLAHETDGISIAIDKADFESVAIDLTRTQATDLIALLNEALEVTEEHTK
jgi:hypothetical protein